MYQLNETHLWIQQHHRELLQEARRERLARRLRASRQKSDRETGSGRLSSAFRRATAVWSRTAVPFFRA